MQTIKIKPLSANVAFQGRRFKTKTYKAYEQELLLKLKPVDIPEGQLKLTLVIGFSSKLSDCDNAIKQTQDILSKKYGFNDRLVKKLDVEAVLVPKGEEFISFTLEKYQKSELAIKLLSSLGLE